MGTIPSAGTNIWGETQCYSHTAELVYKRGWCLIESDICLLIRFHRCCWIGTLVAGAHRPGELRVKGNLTARSDTGAVNHSPTSSTPLTVRLQYGCSHTVQIPGELCVLFYIVVPIVT